VTGSAPSVWSPTPADPAVLFEAGELDRSRRYHRPLRRVRMARLAGTTAVTAAMVAIAPRLVDGLGISGWIAQLVVVLVATELALALVDVPLDAWVDLRHDRRWGLSTQTATGLASDEAKSAAVSLVIGTAVLVPVYALVRSTSWWWVWAWLVVVAWIVVGGLLLPVVLTPLFNRFEPLRDPDLVARVAGVARRAGVTLDRVEVADQSRRSSRDNAYVAGLGPTRRMVLFDTLLATPPELVEQVVAHELGHVRRHHVVRQLPLYAIAALVLFALLGVLSAWQGLFDDLGLDGPGDPAGLPLALLLVGLATVVATPVLAWVSRGFERQADLDALDLLGRPDHAEAMFRRLHTRNLADLEPGLWSRLRASHPSAAQRIEFARRWSPPPAPSADPPIS
jgi:STE24 endopeptidase